jgi:hypothetical protein
MLVPPLTFQGVSMLLAVSAILLLLTVEFASSGSGEKALMMDIKKVRYLAFTLSAFFLAANAVNIYNIIVNIQPL